MQRAPKNYRHTEVEIKCSLQEQIKQIIKGVSNHEEAQVAGEILAETMIKLDAQWAWDLFDKLIKSPGFGLFDSKQRAFQRNVGSWALAYLNLWWKIPAEMENYTTKLLKSPDMEESKAALRACAYAITLGCRWLQPPAKQDHMRAAFDLIYNQKYRFVSTNELMFYKDAF